MTLAQAQAWAKAGIDAGPFFTWRKQAEQSVSDGLAKNWPKS